MGLRHHQIVRQPDRDAVFSLDDVIGIAAARLAGQLERVRFGVGDLYLERRVAARTIRLHLFAVGIRRVVDRLVPLGAKIEPIGALQAAGGVEL